MRKLLVVLLCLAAVSGCHGGGQVGQEPPASTPAAQVEPVTDHVVEPVTERDAEPSPDPDKVVLPPPSVPRQVRIGGEIAARVVPIAVDDGVLTPPADPTVLGWWGSKAGSPQGVMLLTGHTVRAGGGALDDLEDVRVGTLIQVSGHCYRVRSVRVVSKGWLAENAVRLFSQSGRHLLVVVTCEDYVPSAGHYASNVVLEAYPQLP